MDINLPQHCLSRVYKTMRGVGGNDHDPARFHFARFIAQSDASATFNRERYLDIGMSMQWRPLAGCRNNDVGGERRAVFFADEVVGHANKRQLFESNEAHEASLAAASRDVDSRSKNSTLLT